MWVLQYSERGSTESAGLWKNSLTQKKAKKGSEMYGGPAKVRTQDFCCVKSMHNNSSSNELINISLNDFWQTYENRLNAYLKLKDIFERIKRTCLSS